MKPYVVPLRELGMDDVETVGGKNASLGEMIANLSGLGVQVPGGFSTTADAYRDTLSHDGLDERIRDRLKGLDVDDIAALTEAGAEIRQWIENAPLPARLEKEIRAAWATLGDDGELAVAVRSSATAEDLPDASFAGQQETFLNIRGIESGLTAIKRVYASLFNDRAIAYREHQGFDHDQVALSAGIQQMVRSDLGASGVMFTLDTESGFEDVVFITASYGLGETVVQGAVNPDEFYVYKPALADGMQSVIRKNLGSKAIKMVYSSSQNPGETVDTVRRGIRRQPAIFDQRRGRRRTGSPGGHDRKPLWPSNGHRMGQGRQRREKSTFCRLVLKPFKVAPVAYCRDLR